uniref:ANK_REP_REGION domain-containing protein n=1 Tax=Parascaris univalens TaxID=6257 RepID=A0A915AR97_PARUN
MRYSDVCGDMNLWHEAFLEAAMTADEETLVMLLDAGIHPDIFDDEHVTALQIAAAQGNITMMQLLLSRGADVERCNEVGMTAFMHACRNGHIEAVEFLLLHSADRFRTTFYGVTALTLAIAGGYLDVVALLQNERCPTQDDAPTPLCAAVAKRHHHIIIFLELLSDEVPFIDDPCLYGLDAVRVAQILDDKQISELLSDLGVSSKVQTPNNRFIAAKAFEPCLSYIKCNSVLLPDIRFLIRDEKVHQLDRMLRRKRTFAPLPDGTTALMFAAVVGNVDVARVLLKNGVDINASLENFTALMIAVVCGNDAMVNYLLDMGANDSTNQPLSLAELAAHSEGIRDTTIEKIEKHDVILRPKGKSFFSKLRKALNFRRKKIQAVQHCPNEISFYGQLAFRERVNSSMGKSTCLVPSRVFEALVCPDSTEYSEGYETNVPHEQNPQTKHERILDSYSDEDIDRLFRRRNCGFPIPHRTLHRLVPNTGESCTSVIDSDLPARSGCSYSQESSSSNEKFELTRLHMDGSRLSRNISELRANFFSFDAYGKNTIHRRHVSLEPSKRQKRGSPRKCDGEYWRNIRLRCSAETFEILKREEIDESSFALMRSDDFVGIGVPTCDVVQLLQLRREICIELTDC